MSAEDPVGRDDRTDATGEVLESVDGGAWRTAFTTKAPALRIDTGADTCQGVADPNPAPGTDIGTMLFRPGQKTWITITMAGPRPPPSTSVPLSAPPRRAGRKVYRTPILRCIV